MDFSWCEGLTFLVFGFVLSCSSFSSSTASPALQHVCSFFSAAEVPSSLILLGDVTFNNQDGDRERAGFDPDAVAFL